MARCQLLELCQELRDIVYEYALLDDHLVPDGQNLTEVPSVLGQDDAADQNEKTHRRLLTPATAPSPAWLNLLRIPNRQLHAEVTDFLARRATKTAAAVASFDLQASPETYTLHTSAIPSKPARLTTLDLTICLDDASLSPTPTLAETAWYMLSRYQTHGPFMARSEPLETPLKVEQLRVTLAKPETTNFCYDNPIVRMRGHFRQLCAGLAEERKKRDETVEVLVKFGGKGWLRI